MQEKNILIHPHALQKLNKELQLKIQRKKLIKNVFTKKQEKSFLQKLFSLF